ncbi:hypothetical protein ALC53_01270 [Atta colombica]|uniref:Uncharacterized protein n=1 Tax=Atta colombica TaxID=520822 RepID=A0A195BUF5_9HYME|nr:hypothetical protein ALC53_01270 [Atta colombica]
MGMQTGFPPLVRGSLCANNSATGQRSFKGGGHFMVLLLLPLSVVSLDIPPLPVTYLLNIFVTVMLESGRFEKSRNWGFVIR